MATTPTNILQQVATYADAKLAYLQNLNCFVANCNTKFKDFQNMTANLGNTINIELPTRSSVSNGLVARFQGVEQLLQPLVCDQAANAANAFTDQQFVFNAREYMEKFGMSRIQELSAQIESNVALNATSSVPVMTTDNSGGSVPTGALHTESGPFRFYGDGTTPINSFGQLAKMEAYFRNYGSANGPLKVFFDDIAVVDVVNSGLNQFALDRNNEIANSWDLGSYKGSNSRYFKSNLLPIHSAGNVGNDGTTLTVVSTVTDSSGAITGLVLSGAGASDADAIKSGDLLEFNDGVSGQTNVRYLTYVGHKVSQNKVQIRATADAQSNGGGQVTVSIYPPLVTASGQNQNVSTAIVAGMQVSALPDHRAGLVVGGDAFYLAMPALPQLTPFPSATKTDSDTGVSLRNYYGAQFGQNQSGYVDDCIWASTVVPHYSMRVVFPV
jgi:hypothetical protein